jgi:serine/threonine protein kinase
MTVQNDLHWMEAVVRWYDSSDGSNPPRLPLYRGITTDSTLLGVIRNSRGIPLPFDTARKIAKNCLEILSTVARGVPKDYLSTAVSPANFVFHREGPKVYLVDFLRRGCQEHLQAVDMRECFRTRVFFYKAPEVLEQEKTVDPERSLVWSVAVMMYELVTGKEPFAALSAKEEILTKPIVFPTEMDERWQKILPRFLDRDHTKRPCLAEAVDLIHRIHRSSRSLTGGSFSSMRDWTNLTV